MDVVFLLDSSGSLQGSGFKQERDFILDFTSKLEIGGANQSRVGLVQFSTVARVRMSFFDLQTQASFRRVVNGLIYDAMDTNIFAAITTATPLFVAKRPGVPQVLILVTDGEHNLALSKGISASVPAKALRDRGVLVYAVGIGRDAKKGFSKLVSYTGAEPRVFLADFNDLKNVVNIIGAEVTATVND